MVTKAHLEGLFPVLMRISLTRDNQAVFRGLPNVLAMGQKKPKPRWFLSGNLIFICCKKTENRRMSLSPILDSTGDWNQNPLGQPGVCKITLFHLAVLYKCQRLQDSNWQKMQVSVSLTWWSGTHLSLTGTNTPRSQKAGTWCWYLRQRKSAVMLKTALKISYHRDIWIAWFQNW